MSDKKSRIPEATIQRLPIYLYRLEAMKDNGVERVSSRDLADELKISSSRLRHDFHYFGDFSKRGRTYEVDHLISRLRCIMGLNEVTPFVIVGVGNLGQAMANYNQFEKDGFRLAGLFDANPRMEGLQFNEVAVQGMEALPPLIQEEKVRLGIVAVPPNAAQAVTDLLISSGITGIWNFAPVSLKIPENVILCDEFLSVGIMSLRFKMKYDQDNNLNCIEHHDDKYPGD
ncbi:MAG: redox-sensing transcriptional repressor Rex [bacterium]|nr:redox-sensing transcriptional repressor Rex [bacterium]